MKSLVFACLLLLAVGFVAATASEVAAAKPQNPYRSYNISGLNYGALRWDMQHSKSSSKKATVRRSRWRR